MIFELRRLEEEIRSIQEQMKELPEGKLLCARNGTHVKWYLSDGHNQTYLPKKKRKLAQQLAFRKYLTERLQYDLNEKNAIQMYLRHHPKCSPEEMLKAGNIYQELLCPAFLPEVQDLRDWANSPYEKNDKYPEKLIIETSFGVCVRSKSEAMIAMSLREHKIPFRYECALELGGIKIFPDFTIRHPQTGEIYYWEHLGMIDVKEYVGNASHKMNLYMENGFLIGRNLIITSETKEKPLTPMEVERTIQCYFLS